MISENNLSQMNNRLSPLFLGVADDGLLAVEALYHVERLLACVFKRTADKPTAVVENEVAVMEFCVPPNFDGPALGTEILHGCLESMLYRLLLLAGQDSDWVWYFSETVERADTDVSIYEKYLPTSLRNQIANLRLRREWPPIRHSNLCGGRLDAEKWS
jgi:hypothetical protein